MCILSAVRHVEALNIIGLAKAILMESNGTLNARGGSVKEDRLLEEIDTFAEKQTDPYWREKALGACNAL